MSYICYIHVLIFQRLIVQTTNDNMALNKTSFVLLFHVDEDLGLNRQQ